MIKELQLRIVEPYFTTKVEEKVAGLGFSTVYGIVLSLGGALEVESEVGVGTSSAVFSPWAGVEVNNKQTE